MSRKSKGKFELKGHTSPGINQKSETKNLKDGRSPSSALQMQSPIKAISPQHIDSTLQTLEGGAELFKNDEAQREADVASKKANIIREHSKDTEPIILKMKSPAKTFFPGITGNLLHLNKDMQYNDGETKRKKSGGVWKGMKTALEKIKSKKK